MSSLLALGAVVRKLRWADRNGAPDRFVLLRGRVWLVELKKYGERPEPHQLREHERLRTQGADVRVIDSVEEVDLFVQEVARWVS